MAKYTVYLTNEERETLQKIIKAGKHSAHEQRVARVLLHVERNQGEQRLTDEQIAEMCMMTRRTVIRIKKRWAEEGVQGVLSMRYPKERPERRILDGRAEAALTVLACGASPEGTQRWTIRLLAEKMVELKYVEEVSRETIHRALKKMN